MKIALMTQLSICLDQLHGLRWELNLSKVIPHPPGYAWKSVLFLSAFLCHKWYLNGKTPLLKMAQLIVSIT